MSSTWALRRFLQWLERRYGGDIPMATGSAAEIIRTEAPWIPAASLERLMRHEAVALHVPGFYDPLTARQIGHQLASEARRRTNTNTKDDRPRNWKISTSRGLESSDVTTLGAHVPYNVALTSSSSIPSAIDDYFAGVQIELQSRRHRNVPTSYPADVSTLSPLPPTLATNDDDDARHRREPQLWPLDLVRLQLDEAWPSGAGLARDSKHRTFGGGLPRMMHASTTRWKRGLIHVDELGPLHTNQGLFSANIYLQLPPVVAEAAHSPGQTDIVTFAPPSADSATTPMTVKATAEAPPIPVLQIWPMHIQSRWDWYRHALPLSCLSSPQDAEAQGQLRRALGPPLTIAVSPGDLVLFCVQRPHAAIGFGSGVDATVSSTTLQTDWTTAATTRVSLQCFIQHNGPKERLLIDC